MESISVVLLTKARTRLCCYVIQRLLKWLSYDGYTLRFVISCDGSSEYHKREIRRVLSDSKMEFTFVDAYDGLHGAMNNYNRGVAEGLRQSEYVLHVEDDWILERKLDLCALVRKMKSDDSILKIRLGWLQSFERIAPYDDEFNEVVDADYSFNAQVGLVRRRTHELLGYFCGNNEKTISWKANELRSRGLKIRSIIPFGFKLNTFDDESLFFTHAGKSECDGKWEVPTRYLHLNFRGRIFVSITSYPARIGNVAKSISAMLNAQTMPPDEIHLWLAIPEFPNRERDLPEDLISVLAHEKVHLHFLDKNTFCHKRHEVFRIVEDEDCVFFVDDDVFYNDRLIEIVMRDHELYPNSVINYEWYSEHLYSGKRIIYANEGKMAGPSVRIRWCGQSMIPARVYPKEVLLQDIMAIRDRICPIEDESWLTPWLVFHDVPIYCEHFGFGTEIDPIHVKMNCGLVCYSHQREVNGYERRDNWLCSVLEAFPFLKQKYETLFNYGK